jgi:hypothetical protein
MDEQILNIFYNVYLMAALVVGIIGTVIFSKLREDAFVPQRHRSFSDALHRQAAWNSPLFLKF